MSKPILLIDGDIVLYRFAWANQDEFDFGDGPGVVADIDRAMEQVEDFVDWIQQLTETSKHLMCFTGKDVFRKEILETYKGNRKKTPKPVLFDDLHEYITLNHSSMMRNHLEADDLMAILATEHPGKYIIATIDKDLDQVPGMHFNWNSEELYEVTEDEGERMFYTQALMGDSTDNYFGIKGVGPVKAGIILDLADKNEVPYWDAVLEAYKYHGYTPEEALQQARVARIIQAKDYDFETKCPILWTPGG